MLKLNLINLQQSDIAFKTMVFSGGKPHIKFDLSKIRGFTEGVLRRLHIEFRELFEEFKEKFIRK